jgi:hypothetical protein
MAGPQKTERWKAHRYPSGPRDHPHTQGGQGIATQQWLSRHVPKEGWLAGPMAGRGLLVVPWHAVTHLLNVLAVLGERGGANGAQLAPRQHGLQHVGGIHGPLRLASPLRSRRVVVVVTRGHG